MLDLGLQAFLTRSSASLLRDESIRSAPKFEKAMARASPIPDEAPVIQTSLFINYILWVLKRSNSLTFFNNE
jgi:hypothetical protein